MHHGFTVAVEHAPGDASGPRHLQVDVPDLLVIGNRDREPPALVAALPILHRRKSAAGFSRTDAPVSRAYLCERKPPVRPGGRGHAFAAGPAALGLAHLDHSSGNRVAGSQDRHNAVDSRCARRELLLRPLVEHERQRYIAGPDENGCRRPGRGRKWRRASSLQEKCTDEKERFI